MKFKIGDTVYRPREVYAPISQWKMREGIIIKVYSDFESRFGPYPELYSVFWWDTLTLEKGYLPHGLTK